MDPSAVQEDIASGKSRNGRQGLEAALRLSTPVRPRLFAAV